MDQWMKVTDINGPMNESNRYKWTNEWKYHI